MGYQDQVEGVAEAPWATPMARDGRSERMGEEGRARDGERTKGKPLSRQVLGTTHGSSRGTTHAAEGSGAGLAWEFSQWLMGFPADWGSYAPTATRSSRRQARPGRRR